MKKPIRCAIILLSLIITANCGIWATATQSSSAEPMYVGLARMTPELSISSSGIISCTDKVKLRSGYSANVTWELQSGTGSQLTGITSWTDSGTTELILDTTRRATHGNNYRLKTSVKVYNSGGTLVDDEIKYSRTVSY